MLPHSQQRFHHAPLTAPALLVTFVVQRGESSTQYQLRVAGMWALLERLLDSSMFSPHGICLLWEPELIWLHVTSDAVITVAYFSIPFALVALLRKRRDIEFNRIFWAFAIFIMACGLTHAFSIYTL